MKKTKAYKFRAEMLDDVVSFVVKLEPQLINPFIISSVVEPESLDLLVRFKTGYTLDEMYKALDELDKLDRIGNSSMIRESLKLSQKLSGINKQNGPHGIGATDWIL